MLARLPAGPPFIEAGLLQGTLPGRVGQTCHGERKRWVGPAKDATVAMWGKNPLQFSKVIAICDDQVSAAKACA